MENPMNDVDAPPAPDVSSDRDAEPKAEDEALEIHEIEKLEDDAKGG
jgi:hypothetical protein